MLRLWTVKIRVKVTFSQKVNSYPNTQNKIVQLSLYNIMQLVHLELAFLACSFVKLFLFLFLSFSVHPTFFVKLVKTLLNLKKHVRTLQNFAKMNYDILTIVLL